MADPNESYNNNNNIREIESPKRESTPKLRTDDGASSVITPPPPSLPSSDPSEMTERIRLENIKAGARTTVDGAHRSRSNTPPPDNSAMAERSRMENRKAERASGGVRQASAVDGDSTSTPSTQRSRLENIKASSSTGEKSRGRVALAPAAPVQVGAVAVTGESVTSRQRHPKEKGEGTDDAQKKEHEVQLGRDEEVGLLPNTPSAPHVPKSEGATLIEAEMAPDVEQIVQQRLQEERQNQQYNQGNHNANIVVATAAPASDDKSNDEDEDEDDRSDNRCKRLVQVLVLVIVFVAGVIAAALLLKNTNDPAPSPAVIIPATPMPSVPVTPAPTPEPTLAPTTVATLAPTTLPPTLPRTTQIENSLADKIGDDYRNDQVLVWLMEEDTWSPPPGVNVDVEGLWKERYAMAKFYQETNGDRWTFSHQWFSPESVCEWGCCDITFEIIGCDNDGKVVKFDVKQQRLEGTIPVDLLDDMKAMTWLDISENNLSGSFPRFPPNLEFVGIFGNEFSGTLPPNFFTGLTKLVSLGMSTNQLEGSLPRLPPNVESVWMNKNRFSGTLPPDFFTTLTKLTQMTFGHNQLEGSLPRLPPNLRVGWLNSNDFEGSLPDNYFDGLTSLTHLSLGDNRLSGAIPPLPVNMADQCFFENNCFTDLSNGQRCEGTGGNRNCNSPAPTVTQPTMPPTTLEPTPAPTTPRPTMPPSTIVPTVPRLQQIQASLSHKLTGDDFSNDETARWLVETDLWVPPSDASNPEILWKERYAMARFYFSTTGWANFENSWLAPESVCEWGLDDTTTDVVVCDENGRVTVVEVAKKELRGTLPVDIFDDMTVMTSLDINTNKFTGPFPRLPINLEFVGLYANSFSGEIPQDFFTVLTKLTSLGMSNNVMNGPLPPLPPNVEAMWMNNNRFSGTIPPNFFAAYTKLTHMTFTNNQFTGSMPYLPPNLIKGWMNFNNFSGSLPDNYFSGMAALTHLTVSDNRLTSSIPPLPANLWKCWFDNNCFTDTSKGQAWDCGISGNGNCSA